ncbi:putative Hydroxyproline-rich glycoprotein family protein [Quillaja saponaria]|uniref:Hydroxyproline-rich glycoprotein family protein n=1 Tax=Quillaja saponaria TaxID=32244 RepID=A0AAD7LS37_QUISA|nr:putative Hydroxyproline-rich glycoprotein family protein [Quillaja saponaria]
MEKVEDMPPFCLQTTARADHRRRLHRSYSSSHFFNHCYRVILVLVIALALMFIVIPILVSFISHIFQPQLVNKKLKYLNLQLVLLAIVCGFLNTNTNENTNSLPQDDHLVKSSSSTSRPWFDQQSLRQEIFEEKEDLGVKYNTVETSTATPQQPRSSPPHKVVQRKKKRIQAIGQKEMGKNQKTKDSKVKTFQPLPPTFFKYIALETSVVRTDRKEASGSTPQQPQPSPPLQAVFQKIEEKSGGNERKRGSATKYFFISVAKNKKRQSIGNSILKSPVPPLTLPPPSRPPPPLPSPFTAQKPPRQPIKENLWSDQNASPVNHMPPSTPSPLPPPPPPFNIPAWKFMVQGDFIRVNSYNGSRSCSPDLKDEEGSSSSSKMGQSDGQVGREGSGESTTPSFCSSPDIDTKAENFIGKFKARLRLEKMNSRKAKFNLSPLSNISLETKDFCSPQFFKFVQIISKS